MPDDLYAILGVPRDADEKEIRKAYRRKAKALHPDINPGDKQAEAEFKQVASAWEILRDPEKRGRYDRGEIDATGAERPEQQFYRRYADADAGAGRRYHSSAGYEDFEDVSDLFADLFGRRRAGPGAGPGSGPDAGGRSFRMRGQDLRYLLEVDFLDAARGATRRITLPEGGTLDVTIPAGVRDGTVLRLKGKGAPGLGGGPAGDALVEVTVRPHKRFRRDGDDVHLDLPLSLDEAVLGGEVAVPTISGAVTMKIPPGSGSGARLRLRGKGFAKRGGGHGDQLVTLKVVLPKEIDPDLKAFMEKWRETRTDDPRADLRRETT